MLSQGDTIYYFQIKIDFLKNNVVAEESAHVVLDTNEDRFVINDRFFTRLQYKNERFNMHEPFKVAKVSKWCTKPYWDEIRGCMYTNNKNKAIAHNAIKKALKDYMYENYGRYCKGVDLLETLKIEE